MQVVRYFLTQDMTGDEYLSYVRYLEGYEHEYEWIDKADARRDEIIALQMPCPATDADGNQCRAYIGIRETGICRCVRGHDCTSVIAHRLDLLGLLDDMFPSS